MGVFDWIEFLNLKNRTISMQGKNWRGQFKNDLEEHEKSLPNWVNHKDYQSKLALVEALKIILGRY